MDQNDQYEIEFRARFDETTYNKIKRVLDDTAEDLGADDKDNFIYIFPDKSLKVVHAISQNKAKVALKINRLGQANEFEEIEASFDPQDFNKMATIFTKMGFKDVQRAFQKRHNYKLNGVEIALKYSDMWGYHAELEIVVSDKSQQEKAETQIHKVAQELGITLMTNNEITKFCDQIDEEIRETQKLTLLQLITTNQAPKRQYIDQATVTWIKENPPHLPEMSETVTINDSVIELVEKFFPSQEWFTLAPAYNSIHGILHITRVITHALIIAHEKFSSDKQFLTNLAIAASLHDIARINDNQDPHHGQRAQEWFKSNYQKIEKQFEITLNPDDIKTISVVIAMHNQEYLDIADSKEYQQYKDYIDIIKTADALDRYRFPKMEWRIDENRLKIIPSPQHLKFAYELSYSTEDAGLNQEKSPELVITTLRKNNHA